MVDAVVAAALEHVERALHVGVEIGVRVRQAVAHAGLRGQVHDRFGLTSAKQRRRRLVVGEVERGGRRSGRARAGGRAAPA